MCIIYWYIFLLGVEVYVHIDRIPLGFGVGSYPGLEYIVVVDLGYELGFILCPLLYTLSSSCLRILGSPQLGLS